jgi:hypothetical protein
MAEALRNQGGEPWQEQPPPPSPELVLLLQDSLLTTPEQELTTVSTTRDRWHDLRPEGYQSIFVEPVKLLYHSHSNYEYKSVRVGL